MQRSPKSVIASLLITAVLAVPGGAFATEPAPRLPPAGAESGALVEPVLTRDEAIAIARKYFTIPAELGAPNVGIQQSRTGAVWSLEWQTPSKRAEQTRLSVSVDAVTGAVLTYNTWTTGQDEVLQLSLTREEARAKAQEWFGKLVPAEYNDHLLFVASPLNANYYGGSSYQFNWVRAVKGYPFSGNGVHISVDARSGAMTQYGLSWRSDIDLTLPSVILSRADAEAAYSRQVPMVLQYQRFTQRGTEESEWRLVYRPISEGFPRMNQEGLLVNGQGAPLDLEVLSKTRLVPASDKPYQKPAKPLGQEEALATARTITGRTDAPSRSSYSEYGEETKRSAWDFTWVIEGDEMQFRSEQRVRIDAETGLGTEYSNWTEIKPFAKDEEVPVSLEEAQETAVAFLRTHRPDLAGSLQMQMESQDRYGRENPDYRPTEYYIRFQQLKNGLPVMGRDVQVTISARTGEVRNFWSGWWEEEATETFPTPQPMLSTSQAMSLFLEHQGIEATWVSNWSPKTGGETEPQLVWQPASTLSIQSIDAKTGAPLDWNGRNLIEATRYPTDIEGHYAEREIELLWARGVFELEDGRFNPDMVISADELARWIVLSRGLRPYMAYDFAKLESAAPRAAQQAKSSSNSAYFGAALQSGIILPEELAELADLNGTVTRELLSLWAVRAMGYGRIAKMEAQIEMNFADKEQVGAKYRNAVALLAGLGIVSGDAEENFGPQRWLTRAQAAKVLFAVSSR